MNNDQCLCQDDAGLCRAARPEVFRALGDPTRLALFARLAGANAPLTVSQVSQCCGIHFSGVSRHLKVLREAGLVEGQKRGRDMVYRPRRAELAAMLRALADALDACPAPAPGA